MRTVDNWLDEYGASHRNPTNKLLHWLCVPPIVLSVMGLLWCIPVPAAAREWSPWINWATLAAALTIGYYFALSANLAIGAAISFGILFLILRALETLPWPVWATSLAIFAVAWIGQFIGHAFEGQRPSFFKDLQFLLIGPLWLLAFVYRSLGFRYA